MQVLHWPVLELIQFCSFDRRCKTCLDTKLVLIPLQNWLCACSKTGFVPAPKPAFCCVRLQNLPWYKTCLVSRQVLHLLSKLQNWICSKTGQYKTCLVSNTKDWLCVYKCIYIYVHISNIYIVYIYEIYVKKIYVKTGFVPAPKPALCRP